MDCGDYVVVTNARNVKVTGKKAQQLVYRHHTMFPGGLKEIQYKDMMRRKPDEVSSTTSYIVPPSSTVFHPLDHPEGCIWHASQKQAPRAAA